MVRRRLLTITEKGGLGDACLSCQHPTDAVKHGGGRLQPPQAEQQDARNMRRHALGYSGHALLGIAAPIGG